MKKIVLVFCLVAGVTFLRDTSFGNQEKRTYVGRGDTYTDTKGDVHEKQLIAKQEDMDQDLMENESTEIIPIAHDDIPLDWEYGMKE